MIQLTCMCSVIGESAITIYDEWTDDVITSDNHEQYDIIAIGKLIYKCRFLFSMIEWFTLIRSCFGNETIELGTQ
jgi:hypothetical protein